MPAALSELRELRNLSIRQTIAGPTADDDDARLADECLAAIGNMTNLESLELSNLPLHGKGLACLSGLKNLKSLQVDFFWPGNWNGSRNRKPSSEDCLRAISTLTQIEWLFLDRLIVSNESLSCLAGLPQLKTLGLQWLDTHDRPILSHLPPLARLEALSLWQSNIDDNDLRRLAILPRLKSISLGRTSRSEESLLTPAGLRRLASVKSVEEVQLVGDLESPEAIEALQAVKRLKKLYLESTDSGPGDAGGEMPLDDGEDVLVYDLEAFRRALAALRKAKPGVVTARYGSTVFQRPGSGMPKLDADSLPTRSSSWLPGGDFAWLTPLELADFEKAGWRVSFDKATFPDREGKRLITVEF